MVFPIICKTFLTPLHQQTHKITQLNKIGYSSKELKYIHEARENYIPKCQIKTSRRIPWITHAIKLKMKERIQLYDITQAHESWEAMRNPITQEISDTNHQTQILKK